MGRENSSLFFSRNQNQRLTWRGFLKTGWKVRMVEEDTTQKRFKKQLGFDNQLELWKTHFWFIHNLIPIILGNQPS